MSAPVRARAVRRRGVQAVEDVVDVALGLSVVQGHVADEEPVPEGPEEEVDRVFEVDIGA